MVNKYWKQENLLILGIYLQLQFTKLKPKYFMIFFLINSFVCHCLNLFIGSIG